MAVSLRQSIQQPKKATKETSEATLGGTETAIAAPSHEAINTAPKMVAAAFR
jgi:hypothetical protein